MSAPTAQQPRKSPRPAPGPRRDYHFPRFVRRRLENGLELIVAPVTKLPLVTVAVVIDAGAVCDSAGREGVARLGAKLMLEGTDKYDGAELTERFERLGASIDAEADWDEAALTMIRGLHPVGRLGTSEEVAALTEFLLSDQASFITGSYHLVDGGYVAQ